MRTISIYQVEDTPLGAGGMGRVLKGVDPQGRAVAIKEILPEFASDFEIRTRTEREVELLQQLNNDSIVKVYDQFPMGDNFYIVMELVDGLNVEQYVHKYGAIPHERATRFMVKILEAMQAVHEKNFVHRDMKPSNIMIRSDERICLLDFGIAKDMNTQGGGTMIGTVIGSDGYMSPEQAEGFSIDHRADIYALGCVFYFMLTGHHAYDTLASDFETRDNITNTPFPKLSKYSKKSFPAKLQEIMDHATDKNMMKRYQSCREFRMDLETLLPGGTGSHTVISKNNNNADNLFITVGREGCDIIIDDPMMKVSRSHLDIALKQFTGGRYYVITDHSSNGTLVNGRRIGRNESENIPAGGDPPQIFLACDYNYPLNWKQVTDIFAEKIKEMSSNEPDPTGKTQYQMENLQQPSPVIPVDNPNEMYDSNDDTPMDIGFIDAIKLFFTRAFDFRGRSRRKEFWYVCLANMVIVAIFTILMLSVPASDMSGIYRVYVIYCIAIFVPNMSLTVRRLHDIDKSAWNLLWGLLMIIPIVGIIMCIVWIVWMATDSDPFENEWGPCPK